MNISANNRSNERGSVLFYILIGVALLASLIYAVSQSGRGSMSQVSSEKARLVASEIVDYSSSIANAYTQLRLRGCKFEQINFDNTTEAGYANGNAPVDNSCNIFDPKGGAVTYKNPPAEALDTTGTARQIFTVSAEIDQVGTTCGADGSDDMVMFSGNLSLPVCMAINTQLNVDNPGDKPPEDTGGIGSVAPYTGTLGHVSTIGNKAGSAAFQGKNAGCYLDKTTNPGTYLFYKVLAAR